MKMNEITLIKTALNSKVNKLSKSLFLQEFRNFLFKHIVKLHLYINIKNDSFYKKKRRPI